MRAFKLLRGCVDCGYDENSDALQFDHVLGKRYNMADLTMHVGTATFAAEVAKCEVRCANCHAIKTHERRRAAAVAA